SPEGRGQADCGELFLCLMPEVVGFIGQMQTNFRHVWRRLQTGIGQNEIARAFMCRIEDQSMFSQSWSRFGDTDMLMPKRSLRPFRPCGKLRSIRLPSPAEPKGALR